MLILFFVIQSVNIVQADDHHKYDDYYTHEKHEKHKRHEKYDDDWDDYWDDWDDRYERENKYKSQNLVQPSFWNIWTRDTNISINGNLPIQEAKDFIFEWNGKSENFFVLPANGQLLISGEKMAKFLGVKYTFYNQSRILELSNEKEELIVRAGSNAAYENMVKTPMPTKAIIYENTVYLPISVITNTFGYSVNWDETKQTFILQSFNERGEKIESKQ